MKVFRVSKTAALFFASLIAITVPAFVQASQDDEIAAIRNVIATSMSNLDVDSIEPSAVDGLYEITLANAQVIFASADARYFIPGDLFEVTPLGVINRGETRRNELRAEKIAAVPESEMIIFEAEGERKAALTVFTDVDCPWCRKLHGEVERLNELGIAVRYLAFPRQGVKNEKGVDTEIYRKMSSTWCAGDPLAMMTSATRGGVVPDAECDNNPVASHYQLGRDVGVTGTPALVLEDGTLLPGYVAADQLATYILGPASQ
jgi:thiol:disulfide interchange protein DsbC